MNTEDSKVDALYEIARRIQKGFEDIDHRLGVVVGHLEEMNNQLSEINKNTPNILDRE